MDKNLARVHYFHADASALGGFIEQPFAQAVSLQAPLSLAPVGGSASAHACCFRLEGIVSFDSAHTRVSGTPSEKGPWTTVATASIEGLNVLDRVTADRVVSQILTDHPGDGYHPRVSFAATQFVGLKIDGRAVNPALDLNLCGDFKAGYPKRGCLEDPAFLGKVGDQYARISKSAGGSQTLKDRFRWDNANAERGAVLCSLVQEIGGDCPGNRSGHVIEIPDLGKIFLGELIVDCNSFQLIMLRFELGCKTQGNLSAGSTKANGSTQP